jgi:hypothetical protein
MHTFYRSSCKQRARTSFWVLFLGAIFLGLITTPVYSGGLNNTAQKPPKKKEIRFMVKGNCGQCEQRIMEALDQKGIVAAGWDRHKQEAWVVFKPGAVTEEQIHSYMIRVGKLRVVYFCLFSAPKV